MSSSNDAKNSNGTNGSITLKSFSELANVFDLESLPPGPPDPDDNTAGTDKTDRTLDTTAAEPESSVAREQPSTTTQLELARVIAQLAHVSSDLESMARSDARAREQA